MCFGDAGGVFVAVTEHGCGGDYWVAGALEAQRGRRGGRRARGEEGDGDEGGSEPGAPLFVQWSEHDQAHGLT